MKDARQALLWKNVQETPPTRLKVYGHTLAKVAAQRSDIVCLSADLTSQTETDIFRRAHPERFYSMGMAEQNMVGVAAGMARSGDHPFVHSFGVFLSRRCYDQVVNAVAYPKTRVVLVGFMPGISSPGGASHQAIEDMAIMRATPNMALLDLGEATEVEQAVHLAADYAGPLYLRLRRGELPTLFDAKHFRLAFGESYLLRRGRDVLIVSSGMMTERGLGAAERLAERGVDASLLHVPSIKPLDREGVIALSEGMRLIVTLDNHTVVGGLGSAVAEILAEIDGHPPLLRLGLPDRYAWAGSRAYLFRLFGLDPDQIANAILARLEGRPLPAITAEAVAEKRSRGGWEAGVF